jgi:hypothetical protein
MKKNEKKEINPRFLGPQPSVFSPQICCLSPSLPGAFTVLTFDFSFFAFLFGCCPDFYCWTYLAVFTL